MLDTAKLSVYISYIERGLPMFIPTTLQIESHIKIHDSYSAGCNPISIWGICYRHALVANDNGFTGGAYWGTRR